jgi:hypothetical protein
MGFLPGAHAVIELGKAIANPSGPTLDLADLNFAIVMAEEMEELQARFSTWGMAADSGTVYQANNAGNKIIIGDAGNLYVLDPDIHSDDGVPLPLVIQTGPLPGVEDNTPANVKKRIHEISWQVATAPPPGGYLVWVTVMDVDNPTTNYRQFVVQQTTQQVLLRVGLECRQFKLRIEVTTDQTYDLITIGVKGQLLHMPYTRLANTQPLLTGNT